MARQSTFSLIVLCTLTLLTACTHSTNPITGWAPVDWSNEHAGSGRESVFDDSPSPLHGARISAVNNAAFPGAWSVIGDEKGQAYILWGVIGGAPGVTGPHVSRLNSRTLQAEWTTELPLAKDAWNYPGAIGLHANGRLIAVAGVQIHLIDPQSGAIVRSAELPAPNGVNDTGYNGFVVLADGLILTKSHHRKPNCPQQGYRAFVECGFDGLPPSQLVVLDPNTLAIRWMESAPDLIGGRVSAMMWRGREYAYLAGMDRIYRLRRSGLGFAPDPAWGPVAYRTGAETPGTAVVGFGPFVAIQTNALPSKAPLRITLIHQSDARHIHSIAPSPLALADWSFMPSKVTSDWANRRLYTIDAYGDLIAIAVDPSGAMAVAWRAPQRSGSFIALVGDAQNRVVIASDIGEVVADPLGAPRYTSEIVVWRRASDGEELARSPTLPRGFGLTLTPSPAGDLWHSSTAKGITRLSPARAPSND